MCLTIAAYRYYHYAALHLRPGTVWSSQLVRALAVRDCGRTVGADGTQQFRPGEVQLDVARLGDLPHHVRSGRVHFRLHLHSLRDHHSAEQGRGRLRECDGEVDKFKRAEP